MGVLGDWYAVATDVVTDPHDFFQRVDDHDGLKDPLIFAIIGTVILSSLQAVLYAGVGGLFLTDATLTGAAAAAGTQLLFGVLASPLAAVGVVVMGGVLHVLLYIMGARGLRRTIQVLAYTTGATALLGWFPIVNLFYGLYLFYVDIIGLRTLHGIGTVRVLLAFFLPFILVMGAAVALMFALWSGPLMTPTQDIPGIGTTETCPPMAPQFVGEEVTIGQAAFTGTNTISLEAQAVSRVTIDRVRLDYDQDGTYDDTFPAAGTYRRQLQPGESTTLQLDTGDRYSTGDCARAAVAVTFTLVDLNTTSTTRSSTPLQAPVP